jgi:putative transposase
LRYEFIREQQKAYPVNLLCKVMGVSCSGYYKHLKPKLNQKQILENKLLVEVKALAQESRNSYGSRMMSKNLQGKGYKVGRYAARTLMHKAGIECKQRRRYCITTQSKHDFMVAKNILNRDFTASAPNRIWLADITYLWTFEGWLYVGVLLDLFSRRVVGWAMTDHMRETLVNEALQMALGRRQPESGLLHHSDRGVQYASDCYQSTLQAAGITVSMSRKGNCWDNSVMERFFGSLKTERTDNIIYKTREEAKADVIDYIEMFYNSRRLHSTLNYVTPLEFENQFLLKNLSTFT